jgi:two-component system, NarL family, sensor histidine kinase DesK
MTRDLPVAADGGGARSSAFYRRAVIGVVIAAALLGPAVHLLQRPLTGVAAFQLAAAVILTALVLWRFRPGDSVPGVMPWPVVGAVLALAIALYAVGGQAWLGALAIGAAVCGRLSRTPGPAVAGAAACSLAGLAAAVVHHDSDAVLSAILIAPLAALFSYSASRRLEAMSMLRRTRAELARAAVAEERLRIARDLHDLLGHSLSLITLKAELAGRILAADPDRAGREIAELEQVARQSLSDVREAVAGYRQPDLAAELAAAGQLLDAAGIASRITASGLPELGQEADAALAWAVREGATNVVRHSQATQVDIIVTAGVSGAVAEISDNGPQATAGSDTSPSGQPHDDGARNRPLLVRSGPAGSGLAGLAERVRALGGEIAAGSVPPHGFRLRVVVPIDPVAR